MRREWDGGEMEKGVFYSIAYLSKKKKIELIPKKYVRSFHCKYCVKALVSMFFNLDSCKRENTNEI